jgi:hypothetical protein
MKLIKKNQKVLYFSEQVCSTYWLQIYFYSPYKCMPFYLCATHTVQWLGGVLWCLAECAGAGGIAGPGCEGQGAAATTAAAISPPASSTATAIGIGDEHGAQRAGRPACQHVNTLRAPGAARPAWRRRSMSGGATPWRPFLLLALLTQPILGYGNIGERTHQPPNFF